MSDSYLYTFVQSFLFQNKGYWRWQIDNIDTKEELYFMEDEKLQNPDFEYFEFCPIIHNSDILLATITKNKKQVKVHLE